MALDFDTIDRLARLQMDSLKEEFRSKWTPETDPDEASITHRMCGFKRTDEAFQIIILPQFICDQFYSTNARSKRAVLATLGDFMQAGVFDFVLATMEGAGLSQEMDDDSRPPGRIATLPGSYTVLTVQVHTIELGTMMYAQKVVDGEFVGGVDCIYNNGSMRIGGEMCMPTPEIGRAQ